MEQRKLIKLGNSSSAIALPKEWITKSGLKKGDSVFVEQNAEGKIVVSSSFKRQHQEKEILMDIEKKEEDEIARDIISAYTSGNKTIKMKGSKPLLAIAKEKSRNFLNLELIEENEKEAVFRDLLDIENINIENFLKRMDNNLKEIFTILAEIVNDEKKSKNRIKDIESIDKDITKFYFLIWRIMNIGIENPSLQHSLKMNSKSLLCHFWISYNLEQIGDELKRIARKINPAENKEPLLSIIGMISERYNNSMKSFFEKNKTLAKEAILKKNESIQMCEKISEIRGMEAIAEKFKMILSNIHNNSKMMFYEV